MPECPCGFSCGTAAALERHRQRGCKHLDRWSYTGSPDVVAASPRGVDDEASDDGQDGHCRSGPRFECGCGFACGTSAAFARHWERCRTALGCDAVWEDGVCGKPTPTMSPLSRRSARGGRSPGALTPSPGVGRDSDDDDCFQTSVVKPGARRASRRALRARLSSSSPPLRHRSRGTSATTPELSVDELRKRLHETEWALKRLEREVEMNLAGHTKFAQDLLATSAHPTLGEYVDLATKRFLGHGHFGYAFTCRSRRRVGGDFETGCRGDGQATPDTVVVKIQGSRHADAVAREWLHGSSLGSHERIVGYLQVLLHWDRDRSLRDFLAESVASEADRTRLAGSSSRSGRFFCIIQEFMDGGSVQAMMDKQLLEMEGTCSVAKETAEGLAYLHRRRVSHNDIKPENILLQVTDRVAAGDGTDRACGLMRLRAKLADLGSAEYSIDHSADVNMLAYSIWCMALGERFKKCPADERQRQEAVARMRGEAEWTGVHDADGPELRRRLPAAVAALWAGSLYPFELADAPWLQRCRLLLSASERTRVSDAAKESVIRRMSRAPSASLHDSPFRRSGDSSSSSGSNSSDDRDDASRTTASSTQAAELEDRSWEGSAGSPIMSGDLGSHSEGAAPSPTWGILKRTAERGSADSGGTPGRPKIPTIDFAALGSPAEDGVAPPAAADDGFRHSAGAGDIELGSEKLRNLMKRFPNLSRQQVLTALRDASGHAGIAASKLKGLHPQGGTLATVR